DDVECGAQLRFVALQWIGERIRIPRVAHCLRREVRPPRMLHLRGDGHDVLGARAAAVKEDHRRASGRNRLPGREDALTMGNAHAFPSMSSGVFSYSNPRVIHWGRGSVAQLCAELQRLEVLRLALVTTRSLIGELDCLSGIQVVIFVLSTLERLLNSGKGYGAV